jgi:hypothetical protein
MTLPIGALYPSTYSVPASVGASLFGGSAASASAISSAAATGASAAGGAAAGMGATMGAIGTAMPWMFGAIGLGKLLGLWDKPKPVIRKDMTNFDRMNDLRSQSDRMYSPMFMSGYGGSSSINPQQAYTQQYTPTNQYSQYSNLGMSGFGQIKGFGGMGGGINPSTQMPTNNTNWTGFTNPLTNYGSANNGGGIKGLTSIDGRTQGYNKRQSFLQNSMAGYQLRQ